MKIIIFIFSLVIINHTALLAMKRAYPYDEDQGNKRANTTGPAEDRRIVKKGAFIKGDLVGRGAFADVYAGTFNGGKGPIAIKIFQLKSLSAHLVSEFDNYERLANLTKRGRPGGEYLVGYLGVCMDPGHFALFMELLPSNLKDFYEGNSSAFKGLPHYKEVTIADYISLIAQAARGIDYLHENGVGHKYIKSNNIFVWWDEQKREWRAKISDYGLSRLKLEASSNGASRSEATVRWRSPYSFTRDYARIRDSLDAMKALDYYSLGVVAVEVTMKHVPFHKLSEAQVVELNNDGEARTILLADLEKSDFPDAYKKIVGLLLHSDKDIKISLEKSAEEFEKIARVDLQAKKERWAQKEREELAQIQDKKERWAAEEIQAQKELKHKTALLFEEALQAKRELFDQELLQVENGLKAKQELWAKEEQEALKALQAKQRRWLQKEQQMMQGIEAKRKIWAGEALGFKDEIKTIHDRWDQESLAIIAKYDLGIGEDMESNLEEQQKLIAQSLMRSLDDLLANKEPNTGFIFDIYIIIDNQLTDKDSTSFAMLNKWFNAAAKKLSMQNKGTRRWKNGLPTEIVKWQQDKEVWPAFDISDTDRFKGDRKRATIPAHDRIENLPMDGTWIFSFFMLADIIDNWDKNDIILLSQVDKWHNQAAKLITKQRLESYFRFHPGHFFGKKQWQEFFPKHEFGEADPFNPPLFLDRIIMRPDVDQPMLTVGETHILVLIPKGIEIYDFLTRICGQSGENFLLDQSLCGMKFKPQEKDQYAKINYAAIFNLLNEPNRQAHFVLISVENFAKSLKEFRKKYNESGRYSFNTNNNLHPTALQAVVASWAFFKLTSEHFMESNTGVFTQDFYQNGPLALRVIVGFAKEVEDDQGERTELELRLTDKSYVDGVIGSLSVWQPPHSSK